MLEEVKKVFNDLFNHSFLLLFILGVCAAISRFVPETLKQAILMIDSLLPDTISNYFYSISVTNEQIEAFFYMLSLVVLSLFLLMLVLIRSHGRYYAVQNIFEKATVLSSYFLVINYILSNYGLPSINLETFVESSFFSSIPLIFTISCVGIYIGFPLIHLAISTINPAYEDK